MAYQILNELSEFEKNVSPEIENMNSTYSILCNKITDVIQEINYAKNSIDAAYSSSNKDKVISGLTNAINIYTKINTSLESDLNSILGKTSNLISNIQELYGIKLNIESLYNATTDNDIAKNNKIISLTTNFNNKHESAKTLYYELKSMDQNLSFVNEFNSLDISSLKDYFVDYTFEKYTYKASNGQEIEYYLYLPNYSKNVEKLPVHIYLHGYGEFGNGVLNRALPLELNKGMQVNGIVICPQGKDNNRNWNSEEYQDALIELTNKVVEQYNADSNRISLSGHSQGAIGGYSIISRHPDYFSAFIPISGHTNKVDDTESAWESISNVKIWAFHGTSDDAVSYRYVTNIQNKLQEMGADNMTVYTFKNEGHNIQNKVFTNEYEYSDGEMYNPIDWALSQEKSDN